MPSGGARPGAGAPIGNANAYKHGGYSGQTTSRVKLQIQSLSDEEAARLFKASKSYCAQWLVRSAQPAQSKTMRTTLTGRRGGQYGNTNAFKTGFHMEQIRTAQRTKEFFESMAMMAYVIERNMNKINASRGLENPWSA
tara:strand:- start:83 stop:499 length:417 start_codon:yes stop_codon:yes gene_type:complete